MAKRKMSGLVQIGLTMLAATAVAGVSYAVSGTDLPKLAKGGIKLGVGLVAGVPLTMVSPALGLGTISAGTALGVTDLGAEAISMLASAPATASDENGAETSAIRSRRRGRRQMGTGAVIPRRKQLAGASAAAQSALSAIRARSRAA